MLRCSFAKKRLFFKQLLIIQIIIEILIICKGEFGQYLQRHCILVDSMERDSKCGKAAGHAWRHSDDNTLLRRNFAISRTNTPLLLNGRFERSRIRGPFPFKFFGGANYPFCFQPTYLAHPVQYLWMILIYLYSLSC